MNISDPTAIILILEGIAYLSIVALILTRRNLRERSVPMLLLYVALSFVWMCSEILTHLGWMDVWFIPSLVRQVPRYGALLLAWLLLHLSRSFLRLVRSGWPWWLLALVWAAATGVLDLDPWGFPDQFAVDAGRVQIVFGLLVAGSLLPIVTAWVLTIRAYRRAVQPLHRNRITYWPLPLTLALVGNAMLFAGYGDVGVPITLLATPIAAYVVLTHRLPDVRQSARLALTWLITTVLSIAIYTAGFVMARYVFQFVSGYSDLAAGAAIALVLAIIFRPLLNRVQRLVRRLISGSGYDPNRIVREYSTRVSNIVDLERLAEVIVEVIGEAIEIQRGMLFLVRPQEEAHAEGYILESASHSGEARAVRGTLTPGSPVTRCLQAERQPVTQYAIDLLPQFHDTPAEERAWLADLGLDVYVPIYAKGEWVGLLALGAKASGDRYFDDDLNLLSTLADQTAVAFENARLFEELQRANAGLSQSYAALDQAHTDLERAYGDLEHANQQLQEVDALKSGFIGVITHELRTPFANLNFSLQLMERYGLDGWHQDQREQLHQLKEGIGTAKQMVDNLVTFATLLSKQGELDIDEIDFAQLVETSIQPLRPLAESKSLALRATIPAALPLVAGDRERLGDAIYHLTQNAVKFANAGTVDVRCRVEPGRICFEVEDTGTGLPADRLPTLWDSFAQMADPLRRGVEGLGLGLALVRLVVRAHGGHVYAESTEGVGSTFGFCIPAECIPAECIPAEHIPPGCIPLGAEAPALEPEAVIPGSEPEASETVLAKGGDAILGPVTSDRPQDHERAGAGQAPPAELPAEAEEPQEDALEPASPKRETPVEDDFDDLRRGLRGSRES
jgi:signal transduction histidine kinase